MSDAQRDGIVRRRSRAEIRELAGQYEASGLSRTGSRLSIALSGGRRIEVERGFDARTLIQLLGLLEQH